MTDLPKRIEIHEEGPREGFQIEAGPISTADKVRFCEARRIPAYMTCQCVSFVDARRVPGMADAVEVAQTIRQRPDVQYTGLRSTCVAMNAPCKRRCTSPAAFR